MTELTDILSRLGLAQYLHVFHYEGFESWETLLDITESDLYGDSKSTQLEIRLIAHIARLVELNSDIVGSVKLHATSMLPPC